MDWYRVSFDENNVYINIKIPNKKEETDQFQWKDVIRVCFIPYSFYSPDEIYIFTNKRKESYLIPTEAFGGLELWNEIISRNLFDAELAIKAATGNEGELYCWPEEDDSIPK